MWLRTVRNHIKSTDFKPKYQFKKIMWGRNSVTENRKQFRVEVEKRKIKLFVDLITNIIIIYNNIKFYQFCFSRFHLETDPDLFSSPLLRFVNHDKKRKVDTRPRVPQNGGCITHGDIMQHKIIGNKGECVQALAFLQNRVDGEIKEKSVFPPKPTTCVATSCSI